MDSDPGSVIVAGAPLVGWPYQGDVFRNASVLQIQKKIKRIIPCINPTINSNFVQTIHGGGGKNVKNRDPTAAIFGETTVGVGTQPTRSRRPRQRPAITQRASES
jgi:hypothetical protein